MKKLFTIASLAALCLVSCAKESAGVDAQEGGEVTISCVADGDVTTELTRAEEVQIDYTKPELKDFSLVIDGLTGFEGVSLDEYDKSYASVEEFNGTYLPRGNYTAQVSTGDVKNEGYDMVALVSEVVPFEVKPRQLNEVTINTRILNALVKVEVTEAFKSYFSNGHSLKLTTALENEFDVTAQSQPIFIAPNKFTLSGTATKQANQSGVEQGATVSFEKEFTTVNARTLYNIVMDVDNAGEATLKITLNEKLVEDVTIDGLAGELNPWAPGNIDNK